jgi:phosphoribosylformylglycinamidine cyclo-ligase
METNGGDVLAFSKCNLDAAESKPMAAQQDLYKEAGVDTPEADAGLNHIKRRVERTWPRQGRGRVVLPHWYFANVIEMDGVGVALCTDGVGSKAIIADLIGKYDTIGIDCVAMNVNDMICVGAEPISLVDYIAVNRVNAAMLDAVATGLCEGANMARISISGGEIAQLNDTINGFDLVGMAMGRVDLDKVICGKDVADGDVVIGVKSSGIHSNGLTLARRAFFDKHRFDVNHKFDDLDTSLGEELLRPTHIYVREAIEILETVKGVKALINITSDGLLNLARVKAEVGFEIDDLIEAQPIFALIQHHVDLPDRQMFEIFNMGIGFCFVVDPTAVELTMSILKRHGRQAQRIGRAVADPGRTVRIPQRNLIGRHKTFQVEEQHARKVG